MLEATLILIDSYTPLFYLIDVFKKFSGVVDLDQWSKSTHAIFSNNPRSSPSLSPPCFSPQPSLSLALFSVMFYLSWFLLNTRQLQCMIIIYLNKLIRTTSLFHLEVAHNTLNRLNRADFLQATSISR